MHANLFVPFFQLLVQMNIKLFKVTFIRQVKNGNFTSFPLKYIREKVAKRRTTKQANLS